MLFEQSSPYHSMTKWKRAVVRVAIVRGVITAVRGLIRLLQDDPQYASPCSVQGEDAAGLSHLPVDAASLCFWSGTANREQPLRGG